MSNIGLIQGLDPDEPIYRIFPLWYFEEALQLQQLVLVNPERWEDPFEIILNKVMVSRISDLRTQTSLQDHFLPAYAQCWSKTKESDTLLRAYSRVTIDPHFGRNLYPKEEGVRVKSTPRKVLQSLFNKVKVFSSNPNTCSVTAVSYRNQSFIPQYLTNTLNKDIDAFQKPENVAHFLSLKREAFAHEDEVRLTYVVDHDKEIGEILQVPIDVNEVFEEVLFDPRLIAFERLEREAVSRKLGYTGVFGRSDLYQKNLFLIHLN